MMYNRHCILALTQGARVQAAPHMHFDSSNGSRSYTRPKCDSPQTRCRSKRTLAPPRSSNTPHQQLPDDMRNSPVRKQIEENDTGEQIRWRKRRILVGAWHWKQNLRQSPMPNSTLHHCSKLRYHRAPARRQSGRRRFDHLPPPRACLCG